MSGSPLARVRAILFDKDGTLIDFDATWGPAAYEVMRVLANGDEGAFSELVRVSHYVVEQRRFLPSSPLIAGSSRHYGPLWAQALGREPEEAFFTEMDELFRVSGLRHLAPIGQPADVMARLCAQGFRLGIGSNDAERSARAQMDALGLAPHIDFVAGYDSGFGSKPLPGMVLAFAEHCGVRPDEVALIGDSMHDLRAARSAGALGIAVLTGPRGHARLDELATLADHIVASIEDLPGLLGRISDEPA